MENIDIMNNNNTDDNFERDYKDDVERYKDELLQLESKDRVSVFYVISFLKETINISSHEVICFRLSVNEENNSLSCAIHHGLKHELTICINSDINIFLHVLLRTIRYRKNTDIPDNCDFSCDQIEEYTNNIEYLFLLYDSNIDYFTKKLDKESWELFGNINFYGDVAPRKTSHNIRHIRDQFKISKLHLFQCPLSESKTSRDYQKYRYVTLIKKHYIGGNINKCIEFSEEFYEARSMACRGESFKAGYLWDASDPNINFFNMLVVEHGANMFLQKFDDYIFWKLITYGLSLTLIHDNDLSWENRYKSIASPWSHFLMRGLYHPILIHWIALFMGDSGLQIIQLLLSKN
jgi:hypothetical protein